MAPGLIQMKRIYSIPTSHRMLLSNLFPEEYDFVSLIIEEIKAVISFDKYDVAPISTESPRFTLTTPKLYKHHPCQPKCTQQSVGTNSENTTGTVFFLASRANF